MNGLDEFIKDWESREYQRAVNDCAIMVADWILLKTGIDGAAPLRGKYINAAQALRGMKALGAQHPGDLIDPILKRGELVHKAGNVAEVLSGEKINPVGIMRRGFRDVAVMSPDGIVNVPFVYVSRTWSVPDGN